MLRCNFFRVAVVGADAKNQDRIHRLLLWDLQQQLQLPHQPHHQQTELLPVLLTKKKSLRFPFLHFLAVEFQPSPEKSKNLSWTRTKRKSARESQALLPRLIPTTTKPSKSKQKLPRGDAAQLLPLHKKQNRLDLVATDASDQ